MCSDHCLPITAQVICVEPVLTAYQRSDAVLTYW
jgi:hypothetical protein